MMKSATSTAHSCAEFSTYGCDSIPAFSKGPFFLQGPAKVMARLEEPAAQAL
jgi:hypothetical protein